MNGEAAFAVETREAARETEKLPEYSAGTYTMGMGELAATISRIKDLGFGVSVSTVNVVEIQLPLFGGEGVGSDLAAVLPADPAMVRSIVGAKKPVRRRRDRRMGGAR